jgi:hypothetical protein
LLLLLGLRTTRITGTAIKLWPFFFFSRAQWVWPGVKTAVNGYDGRLNGMVIKLYEQGYKNNEDLQFMYYIYLIHEYMFFLAVEAKIKPCNNI